MDQHGYEDQHDGDGGGEVPLEPKFLKKFDIEFIIFDLMLFMTLYIQMPLVSCNAIVAHNGRFCNIKVASAYHIPDEPVIAFVSIVISIPLFILSRFFLIYILIFIDR